MSKDSSSAPADEVVKEPKRLGINAIILGLVSFIGVQFVLGGVVYSLFGTDLTTAQQFYWYGAISILSMVFILQILRHYNASFRDIGLNKFQIEYVGYALIALPVYFVLSGVLAKTIETLFPGLNLDQNQPVGFEDATSTVQLVLVFISLAVLPPVVEEVLFRGLIFKGLMKYMPAIGAAIITSLIFGVVHKQLNVAIDTFALSLILCFLVHKTKSLWPAIFLHAAKNSIAFFLLFIFKITS